MAKEEKRPRWLSGDDDGRTIADMNGLRRRNLLFPHRLIDEELVSKDNEEFSEIDELARDRNRVVEDNGQIMDEAEANNLRSWEETKLNKKETRSFIFGATAAGLLLVGIFIFAGWLLIHLLLWLWA